MKTKPKISNQNFTKAIAAKKWLVVVFLFLKVSGFGQDIAVRFLPTTSTEPYINRGVLFDSISDCYYMSVSNLNGNDPSLVKLDKCGNVIWCKHYNFKYGRGSYIYATNITNPNLITFTAHTHVTWGDDTASLIQIDSSGNVLNQKWYLDPIHIWVFKGKTMGYRMYETRYGYNIEGIDLFGNILWIKNMDITSPRVVFPATDVRQRCINSNDNLVLLMYVNLGGMNDFYELVEIDKLGRMIQQCKFKFYTNELALNTYNNEYYIYYNKQGTLLNYGHSILKINSGFTFAWAKEIESINGINRRVPLDNSSKIDWNPFFYNNAYNLLYTCYLNGRLEYNLVGLNLSDGKVVNHYYFDNRIYYQRVVNNSLIGDLIIDPATYKTENYAYCGFQNVYNNCLIHPANNAKANDTIIAVTPINELVLHDDTSLVKFVTYDSYTVKNLNVKTTFACKKLNLGNDSTVCSFKNYFLTIHDSLEYYRIVWNTGETTFKINITRPGRYIATVYNQCGLNLSDTINIYQQLITKRDTSFTLCQNDTLIYNHKKYFSQGVFFDTIRSTVGCDSVQKVKIMINKSYDTTIVESFCKGTVAHGFTIQKDTIITVKLQTTKACDSILHYAVKVKFSSSAIQQINVCRNSNYQGVFISKDTVLTKVFANSVNCDSTVTYTIKVSDSIVVQKDTSLCIGESIFNQYYTSDTIVRFYNQSVANCDSITVYKITVHPVPTVTIKDTIISDDSLQLTASGALSYQWSSSLISNQITVSTYINQQYIVIGTDSNQCKAKDTFTVQAKNTDIYIPSAFSPNNDGINDELTVFVANPISYHLEIYNRWNQLLFVSDAVQNKWNGKYKGEEVPVDGYLYILKVTTANGKQIQKQGVITLLR